MGIAEVIILITGAILFTASFFIKDKSNGNASFDEEEEKKIIREMLDEEMGKFRYQMEEATEEVINDNKDKMERAMDRITNEKMSAVNEYSDTVMEQIHKNHDEVMFLYDMLNNKHSQVKNTAAELNQLTKSAKVAGENVQSAVAEAAKETEAIKNAAETKETEAETKTETVKELKIPDLSSVDEKKDESNNKVDKNEEFKDGIDAPVVEAPKKEETKSKAEKKKSSKDKAEKKPVADAGLDLLFATDNNSANNNDRILELHKAGKSNMAIAKELGLGIGEVKLVIDLFEGI